MKANELRIGNLVNFRIGTPQQFQGEMTAAQFFKLSEVIKVVDALTYFGISAIPLSEEWLVKFGFKGKDNFTDLHISTDDLTFYYGNGSCSIIRNDFATGITCKIQYVHQLQNLYFALTGSELIA
jgi:hypothetical protein